jgi:hypothetical protein
MSVRFSQPVPELLEVVSSHDEVARFVGRSDFLECAQARLDLGNRRDGRKALACGGITVALYVETHEEAPRFGLIHPVLPLFDLAAECYLDEHRNVHSTRSKNFHAGKFMAFDHAGRRPGRVPRRLAQPRLKLIDPRPGLRQLPGRTRERSLRPGQFRVQGGHQRSQHLIPGTSIIGRHTGTLLAPEITHRRSSLLSRWT